jgi:hypothetical protein
MFLSLKTLYRKRTVIWPFTFHTIIRTLSDRRAFNIILNNDLRENINMSQKKYEETIYKKKNESLIR